MDPKVLTDLLRQGADPLWRRLRAVLAEKSIRLEATALAFSSEEGPQIEFGVIVTAGRKVYQYVVAGDELTEWNDLSARWKSSPYQKDIRKALAFLDAPVAAPQVDRPEGSELRLEMPHRGGHVSLWWTGPRWHRRVSFWFEGRRMAIFRSIIRYDNGRRSSTDEEDLRDMPGDELLDNLPPPPIKLRPKPRRTGLAQLGELSDPAAYQTSQWILRAGASAEGDIYNSHVISRVKVRVEIDLDPMAVWYFEETDLDDS